MLKKGFFTVALAIALVQPLFAQTTGQQKSVQVSPAPVTDVNSSNSASPYGGSPYGDPPPCNRYYVFADYLLLRAQGADIPYAQPKNGISPLAVPAGSVAAASPEFSSGYRLGGGVGLGNGSFLQGTYTAYRSSFSSEVNAPPGAVLSSLLTFPNTPGSAGDSQRASLSSSIDFNLVDGDFKHRLWQSDRGWINWILGGRYAQLRQQMQANYSITGATMVVSNINFYGGGIRMGLEGQYDMRCGFFIFGRGIASLVGGQFNSNYKQTNIFVGPQGLTGIDQARVVPILDFEAGLGWQTANQRIRFMAGYYLSSWNNLITTNGLVQGVQNSNFTTNSNNFRDSIIFDGLVARLEVRF